jgi:hypothetical protein
LILSVYLFAQLKPLSLVISDVMAHVFDESRHLATVHYENGHYHLHTALEQDSKEQKNDRSSTPEKREVKEIQQLITENTQFNIYSNQSNPVVYFHTACLTEGHADVSSRPPEIS